MSNIQWPFPFPERFSANLAFTAQLGTVFKKKMHAKGAALENCWGS